MARRSRKRPSRTSRKKRNNVLVGIGVAVAAVVILFAVWGPGPFFGPKRGKSFHVQGGETRPVLDPSLFTGLARTAYAAAKNYPEVLDQVHCYCRCDEPPFNHKSLLSCFTDKHGAG